MPSSSRDPDALLDVAGVPDRLLVDDIKALIIDAERNRPRSTQKAQGPSEVAHRCVRRLTYGAVNARSDLPHTKGHNHYDDPMAAIMGTAMHAWMEDAVRAANKALGRVRWIPEQKVTVREGLSGTCDLYDADTKTVLDWKFPGSSRFSHYSKHGPSNTYRGQAQLYGKGYRNLGIPVDSVGIVFISRTGTLKQLHLWREPYNEVLVQEILTRLDRVEGYIEQYNLTNDPTGFLRIPTAPDDDCTFCPWWSPAPVGPRQCGGLEEGQIRDLPMPTPPPILTRPYIPEPPAPPGICEKCKKAPGTQMIDPYRREIGGVEVVMTLCEPCKYDRIASI